MRILVVDDSGVGAVETIVDALPAFDPPIEILRAGHRNIAIARNICLEAARDCDLLAFIDDDQTAEADWLSNMVAVQRAYSADVVMSTVKAFYPEGAPPWVERSGILDHHPGKTGTLLRWGPSGSSLLSMKCAAALGLRFDQRFGVTGGEDTDFFCRLSLAGARIVAGPDALALESVSARRCETSFLRMRFRRNGHTNAQVMLFGKGGAYRVFYRMRSLTKLVVMTAAYTLTRFFWPHWAIHFKIRAWGAEGELSEAFGRDAPQVYARP